MEKKVLMNLQLNRKKLEALTNLYDNKVADNFLMIIILAIYLKEREGVRWN